LVSHRDKPELASFDGIVEGGDNDDDTAEGGAEFDGAEDDVLRGVVIGLFEEPIVTVTVEVGVTDSEVDGSGMGDVAAGKGESNEPSILSSLGVKDQPLT
jgi:hypothetical protein